MRRDAVLVGIHSSERVSVTSGWWTVPSFFGTSTRSSHAGKSLRDVLLPEALLADAGGIALHRDRPAAEVRQHHRRDRFVVGGQLALGDPVVGKQHLLGMRDHALLPARRRAPRLVEAHAEQPRMPQLAVHGPLDEATCTTISGRTQCARSRGRPWPS